MAVSTSHFENINRVIDVIFTAGVNQQRMGMICMEPVSL